MYASDVAGQRLTFGVSGKLWKKSLIMYDEQTNSEWSHILGKSLAGPMRGKKLEAIPAVMTDWMSWRQKHPDSTVLWMSATSDIFRRGYYRHQPERFVVGLSQGSNVKAWNFGLLRKAVVMNDQFADQPVVAFYDLDSDTARIFSAELAERTLAFNNTKDGPVDRATGTLWDPITGQAKRGKLTGKSLTALPAIMSFRNTWKAFHPSSRYATPAANGK